MLDNLTRTSAGLGVHFDNNLFVASKAGQMSNFTKPDDPALLHVWLLWKLLDNLHQAKIDGSPYVPATDVRKLLLEESLSETKAYDLLRALRDVMAVGIINRRGARSRRYFIEESIGERLLSAYSDYLSEKTEE